MRRILAGISCGAVGLLIAMVVKMLMPLFKRRDLTGLAMMVLVFVAIGLLQAVLLVTVPVSIGLTFFMRRRAQA